jgi:hydrogenase nickel incorporation protein HypA/HybF
MHELSLAMGIVDAISEAAVKAGAARVVRVKLRVGILSGVVPDALRFSYEVACQDTLLDGSILEMESVPLTIWCADCAAETALPDQRRFQCPRCGKPSGAVRHGRELEVAEMEIEDEAAVAGAGG